MGTIFPQDTLLPSVYHYTGYLDFFLATMLRTFRAEPPFRHFWSSEKASLRVSFPAALPAGVLARRFATLADIPRIPKL